MTRIQNTLFPVTLILLSQIAMADEKASKKAFIDGTGPGWVTLTEKDFVDVNGEEDTWVFDGA